MTSRRRDLRHGRHGDRPPRRAGLLVRLWRWRTEIVLLAGALSLTVTVVLSLREGDWWPFLVLAGTSGVLVTSGFWRSWVTAHVWCLVSRHRIQRACAETGIHTRSGRLPLVLWITPSAAGEKALVLARAGTCAEDFDAFSAEIAAACYARDAVVLRHGRWANLLTVEIVRGGRATGLPVGLDRFYGRTDWVSPRRAGRATEEEPGTRFTAVPLPGPDEFPGLEEFPGLGEFQRPEESRALDEFQKPEESRPLDEFPGPEEFPGRRRQAA
ncbi:hypothetical protein [Streptosporangium vulgare]|uniref:SMODS-associating 2TM beta-strand rich effector domain-containing protein n=1 Tax=Streptosporangium vulgare TaxID=46190 RepID=A0ABV5T7B0_9ACTN